MRFDEGMGKDFVQRDVADASRKDAYLCNALYQIKNWLTRLAKFTDKNLFYSVVTRQIGRV